MKKSFLLVLLTVTLLLAVAGCAENPDKPESINQSESSASSSTVTAPSSSQESAPAPDGATLWLDFIADMERQGIPLSYLKTLENSGITQAQIMEMSSQEILAKIGEIRSIAQENKLDTVRELLADWELAANDEQFVYVSQSGTGRLELVEELIAAVEREDSASIMGMVMGNPVPIVFELIHEPGEALTLWKHTDVYGTGEIESTQTMITTIYDCALFYQFTDADGVAFSVPKGSLTVERPFEGYTPGDDFPDAQVTAAEAIAAAEEIRPLDDGYAAWRAENGLPQSFSLYGRLIPESYIQEAQTPADDGQRAVIEGAAVIAGEPFYEVYFYQEDQFNGNAYYIGANDTGLIYNISMVDGMPIPMASQVLRSISCSDTKEASAGNTSSPESFLEIVNTEYLPLFGSLINCDDWNDAEEIPVYMFYDWYRDYINSVTTHEGRIERYKLNSDINSPGWAYPSEEFESYVKQYFDVSTEYLRESSDIYQTDEDVYWLAGGGNNIAYRTKVESSEDINVKDGLLTIRVSCSLLGDFSDTIYKNLVIDISGEPVKFVSCVTV